MIDEPPTEVRIMREYGDNALLHMLFGPHNAHLDSIGRGLGVTLASRGNQVTITGSESAVTIASAVLDGLYRQLEHGNNVDESEVQAALRMGSGPHEFDETLALATRKKRVMPRSQTQAEYLRAMESQELVFGLGPAGTGKTYLAVAKAVSMMILGQVDRIILSRPAVEAGERLGFLPGDMREKVDPYLRPLYDALHDMLPGDQVARKLESGDIEVAPLAFMRGRTLAKSFVILDEAQNTTPMQMKMFLTRLGEHSRMVVTGDPSQIDLPSGTRSGLDDALQIVSAIEGIGVVRFTDRDVLRHGLVAKLVRAYEARERQAKESQGKGGAG